MHHPINRIVHTTDFVTPVVEHWLEREIAQWVHHEGERGDVYINKHVFLSGAFSYIFLRFHFSNFGSVYTWGRFGTVQFSLSPKQT